MMFHEGLIRWLVNVVPERAVSIVQNMVNSEPS